jgi:hypothetical protein
MQAHRQYAARRIADYDAARSNALAAIADQEAHGPAATLMAHMVLRIVESRHPRLRYLVGRDARQVMRLRRFLPAAMFEQGLRRRYELDAITDRAGASP